MGAHVTVELVPDVIGGQLDAAEWEDVAAAAVRICLVFMVADSSICSSSQRTFSKAAYF